MRHGDELSHKADELVTETNDVSNMYRDAYYN